MVIDTSALVALLQGEPDAGEFSQVLAEAHDPVISAATLVEAAIVLGARAGDAGVAALDELLAAAAVRVVAVDEAQARAARDAYRRFGKGRHAAGLNYGDCFAYALAHTTGDSILFKGDDFSQTDVADARHTEPRKGR